MSEPDRAFDLAVIRQLFPELSKAVERVQVEGTPITTADVVDPSFLDEEEYQDLIDAAAAEALANGEDLLYGLLTAEEPEDA